MAILFDIVLPATAKSDSYHIAIFWLPVATLNMDLGPIAVFPVPLVIENADWKPRVEFQLHPALLRNASIPIPTLFHPVVFERSDAYQTAVFWSPSVRVKSDSAPMATFSFASARVDLRAPRPSATLFLFRKWRSDELTVVPDHTSNLLVAPVEPMAALVPLSKNWEM